MGSKEYALVLTDNANPTFYFSKTINEDEFEKVKQDQWVLVDISTFPTKINELLHLCAQRMDIHKSPEVLGNRGYFCTFDIYNNEESYQVQDPSQNYHFHDKDKIRFTPKIAHFGIYQQNDFKNLLHFKIQIEEGSDYLVKLYMGSIIKDLKQQLQQQHFITENHEKTMQKLRQKIEQLEY